MADERMPKVNEQGNLGTRRVTAFEQEFMRVVEQKNIKRVAQLTQIRRNNRVTGLLLGAGVLGIYGYSIYAVKQETFLDDFDEPEKVSD